MSRALDVCEEVVLELSPAEAWALVTDPVHLRHWLADDVAVDLREGGALSVAWDDGRRRCGRVERLEVGRRLVFRWRPVDADARAVPETTVEVTIDAVAGGSRVTVVESGFEVLPASQALSCALTARWCWSARLARCRQICVPVAR